MKIKIIGCGFAGLSSALLLSKIKDAEIEIYEKFSCVKPVGAGIVLQPSVVPVLKQLNVLSAINGFMEPIEKIVGKNIKGKEIFFTEYKNEFGMGINRSAFFDVLYLQVQQSPNIKVYLNYEVTEKEIELFSQNSDLVIVCSGSKSLLNSSFEKKINKKYPYGCLWGLVKNNDDSSHVLSQYMNGSQEMFGILPSGKINNQRMLSVFWSVNLESSINIQKEKDKISFYKHFLSEQLYEDIQNMDFAIAEYKDIVMNTYHKSNILLIGDVAHAMSPQLGQGANMALLDSYLLSQLLINCHNKNISEVLKKYSMIRKKHLHFYSEASRFLTPLFQSRNKINGIKRDFMFSLLGKTKFVQHMNSSILRGTRQSWIYNNKINYNKNDFFK